MGTSTLPTLSNGTTTPGPSQNKTPRRQKCHQSDTMTKAYHALAGTAARQPSKTHGPCYTSSPPTIRPPPPPPPLTSRHGPPPGSTRYPQATRRCRWSRTPCSATGRGGVICLVCTAPLFSRAEKNNRCCTNHPDLPTCKTEENDLGLRLRNQDYLHVLYAPQVAL